MNHNSSLQPEPLKKSILEKIEEENVCPRSRWFFLCRESIVWSLWITSVIIGSLAVAISAFVVTHQQYAFYEATHENIFTFAVEVLPYLWILVFILMTGLAYYNVRNTTRGYRYPFWQVLASSVVLSVFGGFALQTFGLGHSVDEFLGKQIAMYMSQEKLERQLWQAPREGRLLGHQVNVSDETSDEIIFEDVRGTRWQVNVVELSPRDWELLNSMATVRMVGTSTDRENPKFHTCGVFPWMLDGNFNRHQLSVERAAFLERIYNHMHKPESRLLSLENEAFKFSDSHEDMGVCATLATVRRVERTMHSNTY